MSPSTIIIIFGVFVAMYVVWMLFRIEEYDETRIIDLIIITGISAIVGGRGVWVWQHWDEVSHTFGEITSLSLAEISLFGLVVVPLITVTLFLRKIDWPYWISLDRISVGGLFLAMFASLGLGYENVNISVYPSLLTGQEVFISAWWLFLIYAAFIGVWFVIIRRISYPGYVVGLFLIGMLRFSLLLTGLLSLLIIRYSYSSAKTK